MCQGTAGGGLTFLWLRFKEFELRSTTHTLYLRYLVWISNSRLRQQLCSTADPVMLNMNKCFFYFFYRVQDRAGPLCVCVFFLTHKPKNKGPCVRSGVYGSQAPAASMPLLRDSSCWPDIAWLERKEATVLQPALFVHRLALPFPSSVFFNDNSRKKS